MFIFLFSFERQLISAHEVKSSRSQCHIHVHLLCNIVTLKINDTQLGYLNNFYGSVFPILIRDMQYILGGLLLKIPNQHTMKTIYIVDGKYCFLDLH